MPSTRQKFSVGLFVLVGLTLITFFTVIIGLSDYFQDGQRYVGYFHDSVRGLNPSAKVRYRGVEVGLVESLGLAPDGDLVEVVMIIDADLADPTSLLATIRTIGITGIMYIDLERAPPEDREKTPALTFEPEYPVIATQPSELTRMIAGVDNIITNLQDLRVKEISAGMETAIDNFNRVIDEARIDEISEGIRKTIEKSNAILEMTQWEEMHATLLTALQEFSELIEKSRQTADRVDLFLEANREPIEKSIANAGKAIENASIFFHRATTMAAETDTRIDAYDQRLMMIMDDLQQAVESMNRLMDQLANHPPQLFFGRPAAPKPIEK